MSESGRQPRSTPRQPNDLPKKANSLPIELYPHQVKAWTSKRRIIALVGGTGAGKTWFAPRWVYSKLMATPGARCLCIGLGYDKHVDRVMVRLTTDFLAELNVKYDFNKKTGIITFANGSQMLFGSADNPLSLEGAHLDFCWIDEGGMMSLTTFEVAQRRTAMAWGEGRGQILVTTIPYFEGWLKLQVYEPFLKGDPTIDWIPCRSADNPRYPRDEIERMRKGNPTRFQIFYLGQWAKMEGLIFPNPDNEQLITDSFLIPPSWPAYAAHDYGWNAPTTGVWGRHDPVNDILYIVADYEARKLTIEDHLYEWDALGLTFVDEAWGDPANPEVWERIAELGYPIQPGVNRMSYGIDCVNDRLLTGRIKVFRGCKKLLDHRATYRWDKALDEALDGPWTDKPKKPQAAEHLMDALRYLCVGLAESGRGAPPDPVITARWRGVGGGVGIA